MTPREEIHQAQSGGERFHGLDALRAFLMFLGIVLHASVTYGVVPRPEWSLHDPGGNLFFDFVSLTVHGFRMPLFFLLAGFFTALLVAKRGAGETGANRVRRVLLPLLLFWPPLIALNELAFGFAHHIGKPDLWSHTVSAVKPTDFWPVEWHHLWFLYILVLLYAITLPLAVLWNRFSVRFPALTRLNRGWINLVGRAFTSRWRVGILALFTIPFLVPMYGGVLETSGSLLPPLKILACYGAFFLCGWWVYSHPERLPGCADHAGRLLWLSLPTLLIFGGSYLAIDFKWGLPWTRVSAVCASALFIWLVSIGLIGLFWRKFGQESYWGRYLSDASYWAYLIHHPVVVFISGLLLPVPLMAPIKFLIAVTVTLLFSLLTYDLLVRSGPIGDLLNGRCYPSWLRLRRPARGLPAAASEGS